jgi:CMP-N,N'-diacetyllegionaminic acid synthase
MYKDKTILALIPARAGSKGIPRKNIRPLLGRPLIEWSIAAATRSKYVDRLVVSTDGVEIAEVAKQSGGEVPFMRPQSLAGDTTPTMDVVLHAIEAVAADYDYVLLLQATSPLRTFEHIDEAIEICLDAEAELMVSVVLAKKHPGCMFELRDGRLKPFLQGDVTYTRRQDAPPIYEHNGALYLARTDYLKQAKTYNSSVALPYVMDARSSIDIDDEDDWRYAEFLLSVGPTA